MVRFCKLAGKLQVLVQLHITRLLISIRPYYNSTPFQTHPYRPASGDQTCRGTHQYRRPPVCQARPCFHTTVQAFSMLHG